MCGETSDKPSIMNPNVKINGADPLQAASNVDDRGDVVLPSTALSTHPFDAVVPKSETDSQATDTVHPKHPATTQAAQISYAGYPPGVRFMTAIASNGIRLTGEEPRAGGGFFPSRSPKILPLSTSSTEPSVRGCDERGWPEEHASEERCGTGEQVDDTMANEFGIGCMNAGNSPVYVQRGSPGHSSPGEQSGPDQRKDELSTSVGTRVPEGVARGGGNGTSSTAFSSLDDERRVPRGAETPQPLRAPRYVLQCRWSFRPEPYRNVVSGRL